MTFKSKRDRTFLSIIMVAIVIVALATLLPAIYELFFTEARDMLAVLDNCYPIFIMCGIYCLDFL